MKFQGNTIYSNDELLRRISLKPNEFLTSQGLKHDVETLESTYGELGYIDAKVDIRKQYVDPTAPVPRAS